MPPSSSHEEPSGESVINKMAVRNQQESPLLRLPLESRGIIWEYAFRGRTVHPISSRGYFAKGPGRITYHECRERLSPSAIYELAHPGASDDDPLKWKPEVIGPPCLSWSA
ncbi:hypothetical protein BCR34DRAFT_579067 [Clohesyomyces aquaticus]|uniref:Uncharacterized protein n=1 Tax=Clohesyomyces aquaticus TaxID=1231657 RepID=A0A1Y1YDN7_9PLEO|nr:hypothetical protein BCR34DRAFT_579067 [Clohesyomyces aquaticus]